MLVKKKSETFAKNNFVRRNFSETSRQTVMFRTHILMSCVSNNKYGCIDMKKIYRGKPKDRNVETEQMIYKHTKRVDSFRNDRVEARLK